MRVEPVSHILLSSYPQWACGGGGGNMPRAPTSILRHSLSLPRAQDCRPSEDGEGLGQGVTGLPLLPEAPRSSTWVQTASGFPTAVGPSLPPSQPLGPHEWV